MINGNEQNFTIWLFSKQYIPCMPICIRHSYIKHTDLMHLFDRKSSGSNILTITIVTHKLLQRPHLGSNIWLAGHSLGSCMALLAGKTMAKNGIFIESFLFNPPFASAPIEIIKSKKTKHRLRIAGSVLTAGLAIAMNSDKKSSSYHSFAALSAWIPCLFVNPSDYICSEYVGYFEHRRKMEEIGAGSIEKIATQNSISSLMMSAFGKESDPLHLIPSAILTVNFTRPKSFKEAHGIHQWWKPDLNLDSKLHKY
ncbi:GDSL esterase/lipase At4g10955-like [Trifolium pratense]|nr:GDSL esterase/lipase At4g10955-like [Trifolium pratense]XP_045811745.1 GDSL esterase/lipase At4g10955-like [Trifolium pratense]XP_045811746.1 GDSL esterase/lipase At4g10955-like [Trifolium pratense]XP_045811747.1 GDSL esterase/lipase At4g10955-like [Trifolium pratense]XP_045811748.1 GDSL esterase/lipase At4g10955-like [Trifolium pratense]CAJ2650741.1 unnamed protein product [Trifolium pratense]